LDILRAKKDIGFRKLARFMVNLCMISHSNSFVERLFSIVNANQTKPRNSFEVTTMSVLMQVKSYYEDEEILNINEKHFDLYRFHVKPY